MNAKTLWLIVFAALVHQACAAQPTPLKRKASLGIALQEMNDSIAKAHQLDATMGVYIPFVVENSTADKMGVKDGDIITKIDEHDINSIQDVYASIPNLRDGDPVKITFYRSGKSKTVKGKAIGRPAETSESADVVYEQVNYKGNNLRSILHLPKGISNPPVVFFIQGYVCQSVELAMFPNNPIKQLIDDWTAEGFAVYRIEKPGMGDSDCEKGCLDLNFQEEIEAFRQGYLSLKNDKRIDSENIFLFGHSIGGLIAPVIASEFQPKGVITYGCVVKSWFEYMQELTRVQGDIFNLPYDEIERDVRNSTPFWHSLFIEKKTPAEILENKEFYEMLESEGTLEAFKNGYFTDRHYTYWSGIQDIVLANEWLKVKSNVLALYGEFDIQALNADHIYQIERIVNSHAPGKAEAQVIEGADHGFVRFKSMQENVSTLNSGNYGAYGNENYHEGIAITTIEWMKKQLGK